MLVDKEAPHIKCVSVAAKRLKEPILIRRIIATTIKLELTATVIVVTERYE